MVGLGDCIRWLKCNEKTEIYVFGGAFLLLFVCFNQTKNNISMREILAALPSCSE